MKLREALARIEPQVGMEGISAAVEMTSQLSAFGIYNDPFTTVITGGSELFETGEIIVGDLDDRGNLKVPIFTKFFRRSDVPKDCSICLESYSEIHSGSGSEWREACEDYKGSWMSQMSSFPSKESLQCDQHQDVDACKTCFARHLESQLEHHGSSARGRLTCPLCNRALSDDEIHCLASPETLQRYVDASPSSFL